MSAPENTAEATPQHVSEILTWLKDFHEPRSAVELLERALDWARDEARWVHGALIQPKPDTPIAPQGRDIGRARQIAVKKSSDVDLCNNVGACAMGILIICTHDGGIIRKYLTGTQRSYEVELARDNDILCQATLFLARGLHDRHRKYSDIHDAVADIEETNDELGYRTRKGEWKDESRIKHHARIVRGFERALKYAYEDEAKNQTGEAE